MASFSLREPDARTLAILSTIQSIPRGHVMTYGQVAAEAGLPRRARLVGKLLRDLPAGSDIPWHRVVNAGGGISERGDVSVARQRRLLESEGVILDERGRIDLTVYVFRPKARRRPKTRSDTVSRRGCN